MTGGSGEGRGGGTCGQGDLPDRLTEPPEGPPQAKERNQTGGGI